MMINGAPAKKVEGHLEKLVRQFADNSEPVECGCEFQHVTGCTTMQWRASLAKLEAASRASDGIIVAAEEFCADPSAEGFRLLVELLADNSETTQKHDDG